MYLLGFDIGSSSVKGALVEAVTRKAVALTQYPKIEMEIMAPQPGWAEQNPRDWWENVCQVSTQLIHLSQIDPSEIGGIGISYQMHGLVAIDHQKNPVRPSIIWCDSRAVGIGDKAFRDLGETYCGAHLLNSPGNFTASKLQWVKENERPVFDRIDKVFLPGDYIAMQMTGEAKTTVSGLSEGIFWDFENQQVSGELMDLFGFDPGLIPDVVDTFGLQGTLTREAAAQLGIKEGIPVAYRAGDQPNNALSLGVFNPGEFAGTGGTSGVIYGVSGKKIADPQFRVNSFAHVNYNRKEPRIGVLLCINGAGSMYNWTRKNLAPEGISYVHMENLAREISVGSDGICVLPFGNGAERMLQNRYPGAQIAGLQLNLHSKAHLIRASLEGIAFAFVYGSEAMQSLGMNISMVKVGNDNLFQSAIFSQTISNLLGVEICVIKTTGAVGAALGAGFGTGYYDSLDEAFKELEVLNNYYPGSEIEHYSEAYSNWKACLERSL